MSRLTTLCLVTLATVFVVVAIGACSLHYHQQADSQTLDIEVMRPTSTAKNANRTSPQQ